MRSIEKIKAVKDSRSGRVIFAIIAYLILFLIYCGRTVDTFHFPYLYAEDGNVLVEGAIYQGFSVVTLTANGTYWALPKLIAYLCYRFSVLTGSFYLLPYYMTVMTKLIAVGGVFFFYSDRFKMFMPSRGWRFLICLMLILCIPFESADVTVCNASLPFTLLITAFMIGIRLFCSGNVCIPTWGEVVFLSLMALSSAACLFMAALVWISVLLKLYADHRGGVVHGIKEKLDISGKLILVTAATMIQLLALTGSTRVSAELSLPERLIRTLQNYVFFPWWFSHNSWKYFAVGVVGIAVLIFMAAPKKEVVIYCMMISFVFMLYCSFTSDAATFYEVNMPAVSRYVYLPVQISTFMLGVILYRLAERNILYKCVGIGVLLVFLRYGYLVYHVQMIATDRSEAFRSESPRFDEKGDGEILIPIPPAEGWEMRIPVSMTKQGS